MADLLAGVREETLDEGELLAAELALLAEAGLALGGLVAVKMLLTRAPVEDLFGLGRKMGER